MDLELKLVFTSAIEIRGTSADRSAVFVLSHYAQVLNPVYMGSPGRLTRLDSPRLLY